ncbi:MAG: sigma-54-dependent Fis family transcriptional regulator, partial [Polyangiaceae bacterium]
MERALDEASVPPASSGAVGRRAALADVESALDLGHFDEAARTLDDRIDGATTRDDEERVRIGLARARIAIGKGDPSGAIESLGAIESQALAGPHRRTWFALRARSCLRIADYAAATEFSRSVTSEGGADAVAADALSTRGMALAFTGDDAAACSSLDEAIRIARTVGDVRAEAVALGSSAIAHQRAGRSESARAAYEASLVAAERAGDAGTVAAVHLNLAALVHGRGDVTGALAHLEAAVDMGQRAGSGAAVIQARLNLANLDIYLGRWARARSSIDLLTAQKGDLSAAACAQLLGLEAEHAARTLEGRGSSSALYEEAAKALDAQG